VPAVGTVSHGGPTPGRTALDGKRVSGNRLLAHTGLDPADLTAVVLQSGDLLGRQGHAPDFVYFLEDGLVSVQTATADGRVVEVAILGNEAIVGAVACLDRELLPYDALVTIGGHARRMHADRLCEMLGDRASALTSTVLKYLQYEVGQMAQSAACGRFHTAAQRLARWLLLASARLEASVLPVTHACIAQALGGPRHEISRELSRLEEQGAIVRGRSSITIVERAVLETRSCECVDRVQAACARLLA